MLLYWIVNNKLHDKWGEKGTTLKLVHAWVLGDKYFLRKFQGQRMLELLCETWKHGLTLDYGEKDFWWRMVVRRVDHRWLAWPDGRSPLPEGLDTRVLNYCDSS